MNATEIKGRSLSLVKLAYESGVPCIVCVRDSGKQSNIVDATGNPEDLLKLLVNAAMHITSKMPTKEAKVAFSGTLALGLQELYSQEMQK